MAAASPPPPCADCYFVQKAMHGQRAGAQAVVVTDHTEVGGVGQWGCLGVN